MSENIANTIRDDVSRILEEFKTKRVKRYEARRDNQRKATPALEKIQDYLNHLQKAFIEHDLYTYHVGTNSANQQYYANIRKTTVIVINGSTEEAPLVEMLVETQGKAPVSTIFNAEDILNAPYKECPIMQTILRVIQQDLEKDL